MALAAAPTQKNMGKEKFEKIKSLTSWSAEQVSEWFNDLGFTDYSDMWIDQEITGDRIVLVKMADLENMGVVKFGPRLDLTQEISNLKAAYRKQNRHAVVEKKFEAYDGTSIGEKCTTCCGIFPRDPDIYTLTKSTLMIDDYDVYRCFEIFKCTCISGIWNKDYIQLDRILDVDTITERRGFCCCMEWKTRISIAVTAGAGAENAQARVVVKHLFVDFDVEKESQGQEEKDDVENYFATQIRHAAEEYKIEYGNKDKVGP